MTTSDKPAPLHPAPWRWDLSALPPDHGPGGLFLRDATGAVIASATADESIACASPVVAALIVAAPEMEALLRSPQAGESCGYGGTPAFCAGQTVCWTHAVGALLARLDAARKAGG